MSQSQNAGDLGNGLTEWASGRAGKAGKAGVWKVVRVGWVRLAGGPSFLFSWTEIQSHESHWALICPNSGPNLPSNKSQDGLLR